MNKVIKDKELGAVVIRVNARARRFVFRAKEDAVYVSVPPGTTEKEFGKALEEVRQKLLNARKHIVSGRIDLDYKIEADFFKLTLAQGSRERFLSHSELGNMRIVCPPGSDFDDEDLQAWLRKVIVEALKRNAKIILPPKLYMLSRKYDLPYQGVRINSSRGRWGSCSARKSINLSCFLMLLPEHLIDYVLLHELCHTKEMNHGDAFWALLDEFTDGNALKLREELKNYKISL